MQKESRDIREGRDDVGAVDIPAFNFVAHTGALDNKRLSKNPSKTRGLLKNASPARS